MRNGGVQGGKHRALAMDAVKGRSRWLKKDLRRDCEARNLSREERKMMVIMQQIEVMEHNEKVKAGRVPHGNASRAWGREAQKAACPPLPVMLSPGNKPPFAHFLVGRRSTTKLTLLRLLIIVQV
jgi:hypothetical protein